MPKSCWKSAASVKNSGLFRQSAALRAWLYARVHWVVWVRQVLILTIGAQGEAMRILQRKVKVWLFGEEE